MVSEQTSRADDQHLLGGDLLVGPGFPARFCPGVTFFYRLLAHMRITATTPEEYRLFSNSYLAEIERMHAEVLTYLKRHASEPVPAEAA